MKARRVRDGAFVIAALVVVLFAAYYREATRGRAVHEGQPFGRLNVTALDGVPVAIVPVARRALVVNVFATWCPPCRSETPGLVRAVSRLQRAGIDVVGVDQAEAAPQVRRFARQYGLQFPLYLDAGASTRWLLGARVIPTTVLVDRDGIVRFVHAGPLAASEFRSLAEMGAP
jgi:cytochrome c biogenesis protein CcmG/thiol:disulfide interchange protein DsbE